MFSLMRNIGSSIGISLVVFLLSRNTQIMHSEIAAHVTPFNDPLHNPVVARIWNMATSAGRAALNGEVTRQATIIAYADDFKLMMMVALAAVPFVFFLRRAKRPAGPEAAVLE